MSAQLAFSRDFEREADRQGFDIMRKSGLDVRGMSDFFERLQRAVRQYENNATAYLRTHPLTGERLTDMQNREQAQGYRQTPGSNDFQMVRAKLRAMWGTPGDAVKDFELLPVSYTHLYVYKRQTLLMPWAMKFTTSRRVTPCF